MTIGFSEAVRLLDQRGQITRHKQRPHPTRLALFLSETFGPKVPEDLIAFYGEAIASVGDFNALGASWNDWSGWGRSAENVSQLMHAGAAAGSSLGVFLLLIADHDRAYDEQWPDRWELKIDPDIEKCPRAPAIWNAG